MIFDSCTFAWHTGQLTIITIEEEEDEDEDEEVVTLWREEEVAAAAVLCCIAGDFILTDSLEATESLPNVFWKKSEMLAELLRSSQGLFLDA